MSRSLRFFDQRLDREELMDRTACDSAMLRRTVRQFEWINILFSASRRLIRERFFPVMAAAPGREYTLLDVGAGGCDVARWVVRSARRRGWSIRVMALDPDQRLSPWLAEWGRGYPEISVRLGSTRDLESLGRFDFVFSNHVLHHVPAGELPGLIQSCHRLARCGFVLNDLRRSAAAWAGFALFSAIFLHRSYARADGLVSIRRAYRRDELAAMLSPELIRDGVEVVDEAPARVAVVRTAF